MKRFLFAIAMIVATTFTAAGVVVTAPSPLAHATTETPAVTPAASGYTWQNNYKRNWFHSYYKCRKWGYGAVNGNDVQKKIPGVVGYRCHRNWGELYWSIDLKWVNGGATSWGVKRYADGHVAR